MTDDEAMLQDTADRFDHLARTLEIEGVPPKLIERALLGLAIGRRCQAAGIVAGEVDVPATLRRLAADLEDLRAAGRA